MRLAYGGEGDASACPRAVGQQQSQTQFNMVRQAEGHVAILGLAVLVGAYLLLTAPPEGQPRSSSSALFIRNAKIWSGEDESNDEADSILVIDDLIVAVGLESSPDMQRHLRQHFGTLQVRTPPPVPLLQ
jgi:hypothetical protein